MSRLFWIFGRFSVACGVDSIYGWISAAALGGEK